MVIAVGQILIENVNKLYFYRILGQDLSEKECRPKKILFLKKRWIVIERTNFY
jgi:hypothetical protein